jgi:hypothetical protein
MLATTRGSLGLASPTRAEISMTFAQREHRLNGRGDFGTRRRDDQIAVHILIAKYYRVHGLDPARFEKLVIVREGAAPIRPKRPKKPSELFNLCFCRQ